MKSKQETYDFQEEVSCLQCCSGLDASPFTNKLSELEHTSKVMKKRVGISAVIILSIAAVLIFVIIIVNSCSSREKLGL